MIPLAKAGEIFYISGNRQLAAGLGAFDDQGLEIRAGSIDRRGQAGGAGSKNNDTVVTFIRHRVSVT